MKAVIFLFLLFSFKISALIHETRHFKEILSYLKSQTLVILDIDDTLLIPVQMLGSDEWFNYRLQGHLREGFSKESALEKTLAEWEAIRHITKMEIVEPGTESIVREIQNKGYTVMGLTTQGLALTTRTHLQLQDNQINLNDTAPTPEAHYFNTKNHGVLYRNGVLFTSGTHKGVALKSLMEQIHYRPERIVFINDKETHLKEVEETIEALGIEFIGLRYAYSDAKKAEFDPSIASYQFFHSSFNRILSDEETEALLSHNTQ